jgi:hypothetical protein
MDKMNIELCKALAGFSQEVPVIHKNTKGYGYQYSNLTEILKVINPLLKKHGLGTTQIVDGHTLTTVVFHVKTGECISGSIEIPQGVQLKGMNDFQVLGSAISYMRRYQLAAMLQLVTDSDIDAGVQTGKKKPKITDARFKKALEAIGNGDYTKDQLEEKYELSNKQIEQLEQ